MRPREALLDGAFLRRWRRETMRAIGRSTTLAALLSGALSEVLYRLCDDRRAPLLMSAFIALVAAGLTVSTADAPVLGEAPLCGGDAEAGLGRSASAPRLTGAAAQHVGAGAHPIRPSSKWTVHRLGSGRASSTTC